MNQAAKRPSDTHLYLRLLRHVRPYRQVFLLSLLGMAVLAATEPVKAWLLQPMLDEAFVGKDLRMSVMVPVYLVLLFTLGGIAAFVSDAAMNWVANRVVMDLRVAMFSRLLDAPGEYFDRHGAGVLVSKFTYDVSQLKEAATGAVTILVRDSLTVAGLIGLLCYIDWKMALITLGSTPFIAWIVVVIRRRLRDLSHRMQDTMADINQALGECIEGQRIIKLYGGKAQEEERFRRIVNANRLFSMKFANAAAASGPAVQEVAVLALAAIIFIAAREAIDGMLTVGSFAAFFAAVGLMLTPLKRLVRVNEHIQKGLAACETAFALMDEPVEPDAGTSRLPGSRGEIEFRHLKFQYRSGHAPALHDISFIIQPGETVALVGASGSGKTTLAALLPRFYEAPRGSIFLDGVDVHDIALADLRSAIALVSQDIVLFDNTIRNNIAYGAQRSATEAEVLAAATAAHAMAFISELPEGLDTRLGGRGIRLSGGQRQRIALARALLKQAPILILDEATSALDTESERQIQQALAEIRHQRTCIVIAHRLSTIETADRVIVLDRGRIVETGSHQELLRLQGAYANFYHAVPQPERRA
ncbi:MAG: lipid A export permease/ATP-binding protein MsbA [Gammaproteobacteria bacterium]|nr:MAG: lipid A export permease/ATP-binding protein MsbA [Gammaproteobacteria bacterium]